MLLAKIWISDMFVFLISFLLFSSQIKDYKKYEKMLSSNRDYERRRAVFELKGDTSPVAISLLKRVLDDEDIITRRLAISALGMTKNREVLNELHLRFSTNTPSIIRSDIVRTYVNFSTGTIKNYVIEALQDSDPVVVKEAIDVATKLKLEDAKPYIIEYLNSKDLILKKTSIKATGEFPIPEAISKIKKIFKKEKERSIRIEALKVLEKMLDKEDKFFDEVVEDKDPFISLRGMLFFASTGRKIDIDKVVEFSYNKEPEVQYEAVKVMAYFKENEIVNERLNELLNSENGKIRELVSSILKTGGIR